MDAATWDDLEEALIRADVGVGATDALLADLRTRVKAGEIVGPDALVEALQGRPGGHAVVCRRHPGPAGRLRR